MYSSLDNKGFIIPDIREAFPEDVHQVYILGENVDEFHTSDQAPNFWPEAVLDKCIGKDGCVFLSS